jgi:hypothetical protein
VARRLRAGGAVERSGRRLGVVLRGRRYRVGPFAEPWIGRARIVEEWTADPEGQTDLTFKAEPLLGAGDRWVAHWTMTFRTRAAPGSTTELDGLLALRFDDAGRCTEHHEWFHRRTLPAGR